MNRMSYLIRVTAAGWLLLHLATAGGCNSPALDEQANKRVVTVWSRLDGPARSEVLRQQVEAFNQRQNRLAIDLEEIPAVQYDSAVRAAAESEQLPDLLEVDRVELHAFIGAGYLLALDDWIPLGMLAEMLPTVPEQSTANFNLYSLAATESGLAIYARKSKLTEAGVRIPTGITTAWSAAEFREVLDKLAATDPDGQVLDLQLNRAGEWYTYAFAPLVASAGGDLASVTGGLTTEGFLNGPAAVTALTELQDWITAGRVDTNSDQAAFEAGRVALAWGDQADYARYQAAIGDDLLLVPLPDLGHGSKTAQGAVSWGISTNCRYVGDAVNVLAYLLSPENVAQMADATGAIPTSRLAIEQHQQFGPAGPKRLFVEQIEERAASTRPRTPEYQTVSRAFQSAIRKIADGADVQKTLDAAVADVDATVSHNRKAAEESAAPVATEETPSIP